MKQIVAILCLAALCFTACKSHKGVATSTINEGATDTVFEWKSTGRTTAQAVAPVIVYKTTRDYSNNVPVILNAAGTQIVSFPAPTDLRPGNGYATPTPLDNGYLMDNRGINKNVAFLDYTYEEYAALETLPSPQELMEHVIDKNPLVEMWYCGQVTRYKNRVEELNKLIAGGFPGCTQVVSTPTVQRPQQQ